MRALPAMLLVALPFLALAPLSRAATRDLGAGFRDHGVATPVSCTRGRVAAVDGAGRDVALAWLYDHRGGYALLLVDAQTGEARQFPTPYPWSNDGPYASLLSRAGKYYTLFGSHFSEFDPAKPGFTFQARTQPQMAMSMTEADDGTVWAATYPRCGIVSFNPGTRTLRDYGHLNTEKWAQYPRAIATDDQGWVYAGIGSTASQIVILDPGSGKATPLLEPAERSHGYPRLWRDRNGKVYAQPRPDAPDVWYELHRGTARRIGPRNITPARAIVTGSQALFHQQFPDGRRLLQFDTLDRTLAVADPPPGKTRTLRFDYSSEGAHIMGVAAAPDGTICGGTAFPMRFFSFNPKTDAWVNRPAFGQFNTVARQGDRFFFGGYGHGFLLDWDPAKPWADTVKGRPGCNPLWLTECHPAINRPHDLLAHPDGTTLILAGTPGYGFTGGGLLFWDRATRGRALLDHVDLIPQHSTMSLAALRDGKVLGGTTISAGTGGETKAVEAELYILDPATRKVEWHMAILPDVRTYTDLCVAQNGLAFGVADRTRLFAFDPVRRKIVHERDLAPGFGAAISHQGPRVFVPDPSGALHMLLANAIGRLDPGTFDLSLVARSPVPISAGGDLLDGRIYFAHGSHLCSYGAPARPAPGPATRK